MSQNHKWFPGKPARPRDRPLRAEEILSCRETLAHCEQAKLEYEYFGLTRNAEEYAELIAHYEAKIAAALKKGGVKPALSLIPD